MKIKYGLILFCLAVALYLPVSFAQTISADQIIVAEPMGDRVSSERDVYLTVNIANKSVVSEPLHVVVTRQLDVLSFADELNTDSGNAKLEVSLLRLIPSATDETVKDAVYPLARAYSEGFEAEVALINEYFRLESEIGAVRAEISELNRLYQFEEASRQAQTTTQAQEPRRADRVAAQYRYEGLKERLAAATARYAELSASYARFFEDIVHSEEIDSMSYNHSLGKLAVGDYRVRFLDASQHLVKEVTLRVVSEDVKLPLDSKRLP